MTIETAAHLFEPKSDRQNKKNQIQTNLRSRWGEAR